MNEVFALMPANSRLGLPRSVGRVVARERLLDALLTARRQRCITVQGPVGSGKTALLVAWSQALLPLGYDVGWVSFVADDNDPLRFLDLLVGCLAQVEPAIAREAALLSGRSADPEDVECTLIALVRGVARDGRELVVVLDDLHHLSDPAIHAALQWLLDYAPPNLHLALASRSAVPVSLARLRAQGLALEVRDLLFTPAETAVFLRSRIEGIDARSIELLHELTDGWVTGLQLLASDWRKKQNGMPGTGIKRRHLADARAFGEYFEREVLSFLAPADLELLTCVAVCNRLCASLCAELVNRPQVVGEAAELLERLEQDNLFLIRIDAGEPEPWYRLHPLLRETLLKRFALRGEDEQRAVHVRASAWFRARGHVDEGIRHAVSSGDDDLVADLVERHAETLFLKGEMRMLIDLLRGLLPQQSHRRIGLQLWVARAQLYSHEFANCARSLDALEANAATEDAGIRFKITILRATLAVQQDDIDGAMAVMPQLLNVPPQADAISIGGRANLLSWLYIHRNEFEQARRIQTEGPALLINGVPMAGMAAGSLMGRCLIGLSLAMEGQVTQAERVYRAVLYEAGQRGKSGAEPEHLAAALLGEILYELNETETARQLLESRVDVIERLSIPDSVLRVLLVLSDAHWLAGNHLEALAYLERLEEYATKLGTDRLLAHSLAAQVCRRLELHDSESAKTALARLDAINARYPDARRSAQSEIRIVTQQAHVRWCVTQGDHEGAVRRLEALIVLSQACGHLRRLAHFLLQKAVLDARYGRVQAAREGTLAALRYGRRLGLVRSLLDVAPSGLDLIRDAASAKALDPVLEFYVERLLTMPSAPPAIGRSSEPVAAVPAELVAALSEREIEVVGLLAQALPNKKIARALGLSPETVKWHLSNIYGKLGVAGRDEAVARVRDLHWGTQPQGPLH